jgi:hypothetical protein
MVKNRIKKCRCLTVPFSPSQTIELLHLNLAAFFFVLGGANLNGSERQGEKEEVRQHNFIKFESWITLYEEAHRYRTSVRSYYRHDFYYRLKVQTRYLLTAVVQGRILFLFLSE